MKEKNTKEGVEKKQNKRKIRKKVKRQVSLFTVMLWLFLITTMVWVTVNITKKTNALEVEDENWNIQLIMYDRSSDTPNNAITECTWNAVNENEIKQLCMQINYACTTNKGYAPGEIEIEINGFGKNGSERDKNYFPKVVIGADKISDGHKVYDFSYSFNEEKNLYIFTNNEAIAQNEHFEGTIQIVYNLEPRFKIKTDLEFKAKIKENIEDLETIISRESNICNFHYTSIKKTYDLENNGVAGAKKDYTKIEDILDNYYWVEYCYKPSELSGIILAYGENRSFLVSGMGSGKSIKTTLPNECVMYDYDLNKIEAREENNYYYLYENSYYYVGYPKSQYNEGDKITNTAELWGRYEDESNMQKLAEASSVVSLVNFDFEYTGNLYNINKYGTGSAAINTIKNGGTNEVWKMMATAIHTDSIMDVEIGDDLLYITRENGEVTRLNDDEYNFTNIIIPAFYTYNRYSKEEGDVLIGYKYEIQVRYRNTSEWVLYEESITADKINGYGTQNSFSFERDDVVGVKLVIKDLDKSLYSSIKKGYYITLYTNIYTEDCSIGKLYNFNYLQVYKKDENGNRTLANEPTIDSYGTESTKLKIAEYDRNTYGTYMQRDYATEDITDGCMMLNVDKHRYSSIINNKNEEQYEAKYELRNKLNLSNFEVNKDCIIKTYDILPNGMELESTKDEMIDSITSDLSYENLKLKDGTKFNNNEELKDFIKDNTQIDVDYDYKNSGRTKISIIYNLNEIDWSYYLNRLLNDRMINININIKIPYDNILEYGETYQNFVYSMWGNQEYEYSGYNHSNDNGKYDSLASDIDEDGDTTEKLIFWSDILNITHVVSSKQSVIKQSRTDLTKGSFVEGTADATAGSEYTYKLRVTTGANSLKDLIIYDNIETILDNEGNDISSGWKGEFLNVDTTYAVSKGYLPVVYYSEEQNPGKLTEVPDKWKRLTEDTDKSTVKSICVDLRYNRDGTEMELSANNVVFVLVNMKAPNDKTLATSANNMFSTNWRVKDSQSGTIDDVEGIYSNQVNVNIYKEENKKQDISGEKIWKDNNNYQKRPKSIIIKLLQDGTEYRRYVVTEEDNWKYKFKNVPVYKNELLEKYNYEIREEKVPYYEATYDGYNVINTLSGKDITGQKTWEYISGFDTPKSITVKLLQDGVEYRRCEVTEKNNWKYTFEDVPMYKNEELEEYEYSIEEVEVPGYEAIYDGYNIKNKLKTKNIEVTKIWDDNNNEHSLRPIMGVLIKLYNGETLLRSEYVGEFNNWKCTFYNLPEKNADGSNIEYRVDEEVEEVIAEYWGGGYWEYFDNFEHEGDFELYQQYYIKEIVGTTITNKYVNPDERIKITGTKVWEDNDNIAGKRPDSIVLQIKNREEVVSEGVVTKENNWSYEFEVPRYDEEGNEISYHIDEKEIPKFYEKELTNEITITNKFKVPNEKVKIPVIKLWEDEENKYNKRPNSVTLQVYNGEKLVAESKVDEKDNWRYEFELPKYDDIGNEIEYRVDEKEENKYYEKRISGYTVINKCIYDPVVDSSDINIFVYVVIFFIAIIGIIIGIIFVRKNKVNKK